MYVGVPTDPPVGTPAADRPTHVTPPPSPPSRPSKFFAPGWGLELEQAAPLGKSLPQTANRRQPPTANRHPLSITVAVVLCLDRVLTMKQSASL